jgi:cell division protein FtsL
MATIFEVKQDTTVAREATEHNARIKERFQQLQRDQSQFAEISNQARASVLAPERPVATPSPVQKVEERVVSPVFTVETLDRALEQQAVKQAPVVAPVQTTQAEAVETVQFTRFAKIFMASCVAIVLTLLCAITVLTQVIGGNQMKLSAMETKNAQLRTEYAQVMEELEQATSYETIEAYAKSQGMVKR